MVILHETVTYPWETVGFGLEVARWGEGIGGSIESIVCVAADAAEEAAGVNVLGDESVGTLGEGEEGG